MVAHGQRQDDLGHHDDRQAGRDDAAAGPVDPVAQPLARGLGLGCARRSGRREAETRLKAPAEKKDLYPAGVNAGKEIAEALETAAKSHKRVLLIFGGNWCYDCHVLDEAFHTPEIAPTLNRNFVVAHIDIGEYDKNLDLAKKYEVPLERGVPAAAVLESDGKLLFTQKNQEFEKARSLAPEDVLAFLNKWKPPTLK